MSVRNWTPRETLNPRGAWTANALVQKGNPARASLAQNMRYFPGFARSREGTSPVLSVNGGVAGMYDWIAPNDHILAYMGGQQVRGYFFSNQQDILLLSSVNGGYAPSFADLGPRLYFTAYSTAGTGTIQCHIYDGSFTNGIPDVDTAFRPPLSFISASATDNGAGQCTAGQHLIGFVFQSRTGFSGKPSPVIGNTFTPISVTLNAGLRTIRVSITLDTPADAGLNSSIFPIMTRSDNLAEWYFVPDVSAELPPNTVNWTQVFELSISDEDLAASADLATDQFSVITQNQDGTGPFNPQAVAAYGLRMCYFVDNQVYISEIDDPQNISQDRNVVQLLNQRRIATGAPLNQTLFLFGDKWTGSVTDNGDEPATWPQPSTVSNSIGAAFDNLLASGTSGSNLLVADESGLWVFDGNYPELPLTYLQAEWAQVNWNAAYAIQIAVDTTGTKIYVGVPLGTATANSHMFVIDYGRGLTPDTCDVSLDSYAAGVFRALATVKEPATNRTALWVGPNAAGSIIHSDPTTTEDSGVAVHSIWRSGYGRDASDGILSQLIRLGNVSLWISKGAGNLIYTATAFDGITQCGPYIVPITPGVEIEDKFDLSETENFTLQFETNAVGSWMEISGFRTYIRPSLYNR